MTAERCLACGATAVTERVEPLTVAEGEQTRTLQDRRMVCGACGTVSYAGAQISEHARAVAAAVREMAGLLPPEALRDLRERYRLRQTELERMLSVGPKTWTRWERGKVPQGKAADTLIRLLTEDPDVTRRLMARAGIDNPEATAALDALEAEAARLGRETLRAEFPALLDGQTRAVADRAFALGRAWRGQARA